MQILHLLHSLVLFRSLLHLPVYKNLSALLADDGTDAIRFIDRYAEFVAELYRTTTNLSEYIRTTTCENDNIYVRLVAGGKTVPPDIATALGEELRILEKISMIRAQDLRGGYVGYLPAWQTTKTDLVAECAKRMAEIRTTGYGIYAANHIFVLKNDTMTPLTHLDPQRLADLHGYTRERETIIANTTALLAGKPAVNVLLYGDAGTGKSSTIKAIANEYRNKGLRLIEAKKNPSCT